MVASIKSPSQTYARKRVLLLGAGYSARALIPHFIQRGYHVTATTRTQIKAKSLKGLGANVIFYDGTPTRELDNVLGRSDIILSSIPPNDLGDPFLGSLERELSKLAKQVSWVGYLSATSVYGNRKGQWVYEDELLRPQTQRGKNRMIAELQWIETTLPVHVFRLAGIYGPGRSNFERLRTGKARAVIKPGHVVNRIHVQDIASAILKSIDKPNPIRIYNLADGHPAPPQDALNFSASLLGVPAPPQVDHEAANISDMARSFYTETKKVSKDRAQTELGWLPQYVNFRQGLMATLRVERGELNTVWVSGIMKVSKADFENIKQALPNHIRLSREEPGCVVFKVWQDEAWPRKFHVLESFESPEAFQKHQERIMNSEWGLVSRNAVRDYDIVGI